MKRPLSYLVLLFSLFMATASYAQNKKVAVVTFYVVKKLGVGQFGSVAQLVNKLAEDPNFNMQPLLNNFHTQFFDAYSKEFPFTLLPEAEVINNEAYKAYVPLGGGGTGLLKDTYNLPFDGYKVVLPLMGHENERNLLKILPQADGVMKVYIDFDLVQVGFAGMGVVKVNAYANIALFNKNGDQVFSIKENAKSKNSSPLIAGVPVMTPEKVLPMCESALTELMADLGKRLPKIIKKTDAKL